MSDWEDDIYDDDDDDELSFEEDVEDEGGDGVVLSGSDMDDDEHETSHDGDGVGSGVGGHSKAPFDVEQAYFLGKEYKEDENYDAALAEFDKIISLQRQGVGSPEYAFKAVKQSIKVCQETGDYNRILQLLEAYFDLLKTVSKAYGESSTSKLLIRLDHAANCSPAVLKQIYSEFLKHLGPDGEQKIVIRVTLFMVNALIAEGNYEEASLMLSNLEKVVLDSDSESTRTTFLLDVLASEMVISSCHRFNLSELARLVSLANASLSGIPQSRIVGTIKECAGLVQMYDENFSQANKCFQDSFKGFNECGDPRRTDVLLKFIVSNMLSESEINPFRSSDFQGFIRLDNVKQLMDVYNAVHTVDIDHYNEIVGSDMFQSSFQSDQFLRDFMPYVTELVQVKYIMKYVGAFEKLSFARLGNKLKIDDDQLEQLLVKLFCTGHIVDIKLDLVSKVIERTTASPLIPSTLEPSRIMSGMLQAAPDCFDISHLSEEAQEVRTKVHSHPGPGFPPHLSPLELDTTQAFVVSSNDSMSDGDKVMDVTGNSSLAETGSTDSSLTSRNNSSAGESTGAVGGNGAGHGDSLHKTDSKFIVMAPGAEKLANIGQCQEDFCIPFQRIPQALLKDLYVGSLKDESYKRFGSKAALYEMLSDYLSWMRSGIPEKQDESVGHLEKVRQEKLDVERKQLEAAAKDGKGLDGDGHARDPNVPDVLQTTEMNSLDPSPAEAERVERAKRLEKMPTEESNSKKLDAVLKLATDIDHRRVETVFGFNMGLRMNTGEKALEAVRINNGRGRVGGGGGVAATALGPTTAPSTSSNSALPIFGRGIERLDTESLESESMGGYEEEEDEEDEMH